MKEGARQSWRDQPPCLFSSVALEPQCTKSGRLLPHRLLGRLVFGHRFGTFTQLFLPSPLPRPKLAIRDCSRQGCGRGRSCD
jgi:hypothetical protein